MRKHRLLLPLLSVAMWWGVSAAAGYAQSSSLYVLKQEQDAAPSRPVDARGQPNPLSPDVAAVSYTAVTLPPPRKFARHDLVTIIVRESAEADVSASLGTEKETKVKGALKAFPRLQLKDLLNLQLRDNVITDPPSVDVGLQRDFEGSGDYKTEDSVTTRITARIIDVKPNGTLVLEARKFQQIDQETLELVVTGTCRKEDVRSDNTVLSTQLYDLHLAKKHTGDIRRSTRKGLLTRVLETVFHF